MLNNIRENIERRLGIARDTNDRFGNFGNLGRTACRGGRNSCVAHFNHVRVLIWAEASKLWALHIELQAYDIIAGVGRHADILWRSHFLI